MTADQDTAAVVTQLEEVTDENSPFMKAIEEFKEIALHRALAKYEKPFSKAMAMISSKISMTDEDNQWLDETKNKHRTAIMEKLSNMFDERVLGSDAMQALLNQLFELQQMVPDEDVSSELCPVRVKYYPLLRDLRTKLESISETASNELQDCESELFIAQTTRKRSENEIYLKLRKFDQMLMKTLEQGFGDLN